MRLIGVLSVGDALSPEESQDGLEALNAMLDSFANDKQVIYASTLDTIAWSPSTSSYTVGPTGTHVSARPVTLLTSCYFDWGGVSYPLVPITVDEYNQISLKGLNTTIPQYIWCNPTFPDSTITIWPTPSDAVSVKLWSNKILLNVPTLTTPLDLPPGYKDFIDYNLAERLAPEYEVQVPMAVAKHALLTRKAIARTNFVSLQMSYPASSTPNHSQFNIYSGQPL
jgi:hypothetical protein